MRNMDNKAKYCGKKVAETLKNILHQLQLGGKQSNKKTIGYKKVRLYIFYIYTTLGLPFIFRFSWASLSFSATAPTFYF